MNKELTTIEQPDEQQQSRHEFGGRLDGTLAAISMGSLVTAEIAEANPIVKWIALGATAISGGVLTYRMLRSGVESPPNPDENIVEHDG